MPTNRIAMELPFKITPCPIVESSLEFRFKSSLPADAIIGVLYTGFSNKGSSCDLSTLPIAQIPFEIRKQDPNLAYKPTHKLHLNHNNCDALIGSNVIILTIPGEYVGWNDFFRAISEFLETLKKIPFIQTIEYVGLRYLNFFPFNIFEKINLKIDFKNLNTNAGTVLRTEFNFEDYSAVLQITTGVHLQNILKKIDADGSLIDITTVLVGKNIAGITLDNITDKIQLIHQGEKELFFSLLTEKYLNELKPKY